MVTSSWHRGRWPEEMRLRGELQREAGGEDTGEEIREDVQEDAMEGVSLDQYPLSLPELHVVDSISE